MKNTAQEMKFSIKDFLSKCDQIRSGEILNGKLHFLCSEINHLGNHNSFKLYTKQKQSPRPRPAAL